MTIMFDSSHLCNPTLAPARPFAAGLAPAVDPTDYAPAFQPTPADDAWVAQTSPLNALDDDGDALDALYSEIETDDPADYREPTGSAWGSHPDRLDLDA